MKLTASVRLASLALATLVSAFRPELGHAQTALVTVTSTSAVSITTNIPVPASSGSTYVLEKYSTGELTLSGQLTGGAGSILRTTTQTTGDTTTLFDFAVNSPTYAGSIQTWRGVVIAGATQALGTGTIYMDGNLSTNGDLTFGGSFTFTNPIVLQESDTISSSAYSVTLNGGITDGGGGYSLTKYGPGTLTLAGVNAYSGTTSIGSSTGLGGTLALGENNALPSGMPLIVDNRFGASIFNLGSYTQNVGNVTFYAGAAIRTNITGTGSLQLSGNLTLVDPHVTSGNQDYALAINAPIDLHGATRVFTVGYGNNAESSDLGDLHLNGGLINSTGMGGVIFTNWANGNSNLFGSVTIQAPSSYNGSTTLYGGTGAQGTSTLALNANNAIPNTSAFIQSTNTILDLTAWGKNTGITTGMGSLTGSGKIVLGSAGVLTVGYDNTSPAAYAGVITNSGGALIKTGSGTLTLSGSLGSVASGKTVVNGGTLLVNGAVNGGVVDVVNGGTLAGSGTVNASVVVSNGAILTAGNGSGTGMLTMSSLTLGAAPTDAITLNCSASSASGVTALFNVIAANGFTNNGTITINVTGSLPATVPAAYNLITYSGSLVGSGTLVTGSVPGAGAYITNNASASAIQLVVPPLNTTSLTWVGTPLNNWDLSGNNVWVQTGTTIPSAFSNEESVVFDDTATNFTVNLAATVSPAGVLFTNNLNNYILSGVGSLSNALNLPASLIKQGVASLTLATTNVYSGNTTIGAGTLVLGAAGAIPSGPAAGNVTVNGTLDLGGFSPVLNNLTGSGVVDNISAGGSPILSVSNTANLTFNGTIQNSSGSVALNLVGTGSLTLPGNNTYTGGTTIGGGSLNILTAGGAGSGPVAVTENLAGGTATFLSVATSSAVTLSNSLTLPNTSGTYALSKNASGQLTLAGAISGGGSGLTLRTTTDTAGDTTTPFEFAGNNSGFAGNFQTYRGSVLVDNANALGTGTIYGDGGNGTSGDLFFNANMTFANTLVIQSATSLSSGTNNVTLSGNVSGNGTLTKDGAGTLNLSGNLGYNGGLVVNAGTASIGSILLAGDTTSGGGLGAAYTNYISIASGATLQSAGTLTLYESSSLNPYTGVSGAGTLMLVATNNNANSPDISFAANDTIANSTANWGNRISSAINLGNAQRYIWGRTDHTSVDVYGVNEADCQFAGPISGSSGLTFVAQNNSSGSDAELMETPFCLNATNTFTGPVQIQRGSVYLGTNNAFPPGNVLNFNVAAGNNGKFFLYGHNTTVADLSSTGAGTALIANGNRNPSPILPATLTITMNNPETYSGSLVDTNAEYTTTTTGATTTLSLVKNGPASLTLNGALAFSGPLTVNAGKLFIDTASTGSGAVTVTSGGTLGGNGTINAAVTATNGAALEAGGGSGIGSLSLNSLALGVNPATDNLTLNCESVPSGINSLTIVNANGLTNNATVTVNVTGVMPATTPAVYTLISYAGTIAGGGSFVLGSVPDQAVAYLTNNTAASAIQLVVSSVIIPSVTWVGSPTNDWDLLGGDVWTQTGTNLPAAYVDLDQAVFDDTATNFNVNLATVVNPNGVLFTNNVNNYNVSGTGSLAGYTSLTLAGNGTVTLSTSNNYSGPTTITAGTLVLGNTNAVPGGAGAGNVTVNGTLDTAGFSPTFNNLSGSGIIDDINAGGLPVVTISNNTASIFSGVMQNTSGSLELNFGGTGTLSLDGPNSYSGATIINSGTLQVGAGGASGTLGTGSVLDMGTLAFDRTDNYTNDNNIAGTGILEQNGSGMVTLDGNLTYSGATLANAGTLVFPHDVTFDAGVGETLTVASNAVVETGFEIFLNANASAVATDISGAGTTRLISTLNRIESYADVIIGANNNGVSTANYGIRIASGLDLGSTERLFWAYSSRDDVATYGLNGCDCQFAGPLEGTAQLILLGQNSWPGVNTMEEQFALNASNSWTGTLEVRRGSVYLGNAHALVNTNGLILDPAASVNARFFLYGYNATVSDLQSGGYGDTVIANGNNVTSSNVGPATLTVMETNSTTFAGNIADWYTEYTAPPTGAKTPTLSLVKNGPATLILAGTNTYSGTTVINAGELDIDGSFTGGGAITVGTNAVLGGNGLVTSAVTVLNGGAIQTGSGNLTLKSLTLGNLSGDTSFLNVSPSALLVVTNNNGLVLNGGANSVTVNLDGGITALGSVPLITYAGTLGGTGFGAFQLGSLPPGILGYLSNDTAHATIDFVATQVTIPRWTGDLSSEWSANVLALPKNWVLNADGVTPEDYVDGENVIFDDTATNTLVTLNVANVSPSLVNFTNSINNYTVTGNYGITGNASLIKQGNGTVTLATVNTYSGATTIASGTLALGNAAAIPGGMGAGNVTVNGTLDVADFNAMLNNLSGTGTLDDVSAGGFPTVTIDSTAISTFGGIIKNTTGSVGLTVVGTGTLNLSGANTYSGPTTVSGNLLVNGSLAAGGLTVQAGATLGGSGIINGRVTLASGSTLNLTANSPLTAGALTLNGAVTVNAGGNITTSNSATYVLLDYAGINSTNLFQLAAVPGILNSGYTANLNVTTNQLQLVIAPIKPTGTIADVRHVVIFMQENRSFDHYFGSLHGVHGFSDHIMLTLTNGNSDLYQPSGTGYELPFHSTIQCLSDLDHSWSATHQAVNAGWNNGWVAAKGTETMAYYNRSDLPYYYALADNFTICDEYHCSILTSTDPNRVFFMTGWNDPNDQGGGPLIDNTEPANGWGTNWVTYPEMLQKAGVTWKIYQASDNYDDNALNWFAAYKDAAVGTPLYNNGEQFAPSLASGTGFQADLTNLVAEFKNAVISNTLPSVSWIIGPDVGSEHPSWSPEDGEILTKGLLDALASNPSVYNSTVFILNYDENDGFYDHAVPINPPAGTTNEFDSGLPYGLGIRVPCIIISPWSTGGYVCSQVFDHTSVIRFLEKWTGVKDSNISAWRRQVSGDLTSAFDFTHLNTNYPGALTLAAENDCSSGSTASPPGTQTVPVQESGTLAERPLPYQPNATPVLNSSANTVGFNLTNAGSVSMHFSIYPNAYSTIAPQPYDVNSNATTMATFSTASTGGKYDFSCYSANGFLRRFAGNMSADYGQIEAISYLNPITDGFKITLANPSSSAVVFSVTNGWVANSLTNYTVPANTTNVVFADASTNNGWYDLTVTASSDNLFVRRFAGHIETNAAPTGIISSENPSGFKDTVTFTATFAGYGTPTGTAQFMTNGVPLGSPVALNNGVASISTANLPRTNNAVTVVYSGDSLNASATNSLVQVVLDHPPVPTTVVYQRAANLPLNILISDLLTNVTDVDGDPITLVGVGTDGLNLTTTNGVTLTTNANYIVYTNSVTPNVNDSFEYTVSDGHGGVSLGTIMIVVNTNYVVPASATLIVSTTNALVNFFGTPGAQYEVDRSTNLAPGVGSGWVPISTNVAPVSGIIQVNDLFQNLGLPGSSAPPAAFYRLRPNP